MLELLTAYSGKEIITFIVILALAVKGVISFFEWGIPKVFGAVHKVDEHESLKQKVEEMDERQQKVEHKVDLLIKSSILDFRSQLVQQHHHFIQQGWIDSYSLAALVDQFEVYIEEGGNSFAQQLMDEIKQLDKEPLNDKGE